jgi:hypothetical protein
MLTLSGCSFGDGDILVIPKNFKGYIVIIYDQKTGILPKREGRKTVYEIPANGILKVQNEINTGWREFADYYYEKIAPENKLPAYNISKEIPTGVIGGFEGATGGANKDLAGKEVVRFAFFYIGTKSEIEQYKEQADKLDIVKLTE